MKKRPQPFSFNELPHEQKAPRHFRFSFETKCKVRSNFRAVRKKENFLWSYSELHQVLLSAYPVGGDCIGGSQEHLSLQHPPGWPTFFRMLGKPRPDDQTTSGKELPIECGLYSAKFQLQ